MKSLRVRVTRSHVLGLGRFAEVGDILTLREDVALERINSGACELAPPEAAPGPPAPAAAVAPNAESAAPPAAPAESASTPPPAPARSGRRGS